MLILNGDGPCADVVVLPPKGLLPNGAEERGDEAGAVPKADGAVPNGDGFGAALPVPKGDGLGANAPNADAAGVGAAPKVDELDALVAPKGDGFVGTAMPNGEVPEVGNEENGDGAAIVVVIVAGAGADIKPDESPLPPARFEANAPVMLPNPDD